MGDGTLERVGSPLVRLPSDVERGGTLFGTSSSDPVLLLRLPSCGRASGGVCWEQPQRPGLRVWGKAESPEGKRGKRRDHRKRHYIHPDRHGGVCAVGVRRETDRRGRRRQMGEAS